MFKNKNVLAFFYKMLLIIILVIIISTIFSFGIIKIFSKTLIQSNNKIINQIVINHPELEDEIISSLLTEGSIKEDYINNYGISADYLYELRNIKMTIIITNIAIILLSVIAIIICFINYIKKEHRELSKISTSINKVLNNDYSINIKEYNEGYISCLSNDVYKVITELKEQRDISLQDKKYLTDTLSDISHQLRTPLTSMYVINDLLENNMTMEQRHSFLSQNKDQLERIEWLVTSLLKLSRLDSGSVTLLKEEVNCRLLVEKAIDPIRINLEAKEINVHNNIADHLVIKVDFKWTVEAIVNIIKNAYEYTPVKGSITIEGKENPLYTEITITDTGCGIASDKLPYIFDRFYKVNNDSNSIGIGLNMTKRIIKEQRGDITVVSKLGQGTTFIIKFYKNII